MMASYIVGAGHAGHQHFGGRLPTIFEIQELIEAAWDRGINAQARVETGGIRGTRKYIGTPEVSPPEAGWRVKGVCVCVFCEDERSDRKKQAQAVLYHLGIP